MKSAATTDSVAAPAPATAAGPKAAGPTRVPPAVAARAAALDDERLLAECEIEIFTGGGPGGQHRNKTQSAVRLRHLPTGLVVTATERRSQGQNRDAALERLRARLAQAAHVPKPRRKTRPTAGSQRRRLDSKRRRSETKRGRSSFE